MEDVQVLLAGFRAGFNCEGRCGILAYEGGTDKADIEIRTKKRSTFIRWVMTVKSSPPTNMAWQ